jgi:hypothetical protein
VASQLNLSHLKAMDKSAAQDCFASYESVDDGVVKHGGVGKEPKKLALFFINFPFSFSRKKKNHTILVASSLFISCPLLADVAYPIHEIRVGLSKEKCCFFLLRKTRNARCSGEKTN